MSRPRVLILTTYYAPVLGGVETHARQLAVSLRDQGFPVQVVTKHPGGRAPRVERLDGIVVHRVGPGGARRGSGKWIAAPFLFAKAATLRGGFDVAVCVDYRGIGLAALAAARVAGRRPIVAQAATAGVLGGTDRTSAAETGVPPEGVVASLLKAPVRLLYRRLDHFVCVSRDIERETRAAGIPDERIHYVPHGVDVERFRPAPPAEREAIRRTAGWPLDRSVVLFVGRLSREKGVLDLLDAWRRLARTDAVLVLVGPDMPGHPWDAGAPARAFVAEHHLEATVRFAGPAADPAPLYRAADVFAQPSHFEAFGISAIEAMASGLPIVASRVGGLRDFLTDGDNAALHPPHDPAGIAAALAPLLDDAALRRRLGAAGRVTVVTRFDEREVFARYAALVAAAAGLS